MAKVASQVFEDNNFSGTVKVLPKYSTELVMKPSEEMKTGSNDSMLEEALYDLEEGVDIVVGEVLGDNPTSEAIVPIFKHARVCGCPFLPVLIYS